MEMRQDMTPQTRIEQRMEMLRRIRARTKFIALLADSDLSEAVIAASTFGFAFKIYEFQNVADFSVRRATEYYGVPHFVLQSVWWATAGAITYSLLGDRLELRRAVMVWAAFLWTSVAVMLTLYPQRALFDIQSWIFAAACWVIVARNLYVPYAKRKLLREMDTYTEDAP